MRVAGAMALMLVIALVGVPSATAAAGPPAPSSDPFYSYTGPLGKVAPGTVLRHRTVTLDELGAATPLTATQILYRTTGELGQPTATVATIIRPSTQPAATRIVSYQTAYDALGPQCDPSYTLRGGNASYSTAQDEEQLILAYAAQGDTVVVPDYEGERLDWGAGQESGYGTLDAIRATESLLGVPQAGTPVGMVGYSGGSIATEFAAELAPTYAPALDVVGTAAGGVPVDFLHNLAYVNGSPSWSGVIPAVVVSLARAFGVSFTQYLSPYGKKVTTTVAHQCINDFVGKYPGLRIQKLLRPRFANVLKLPTIVEVANHLIMGRTGTPRGPLLIGVGNADGTGDGIMVTRDVEALAHTYCDRGVSVQFNQYGGDDHTSAAVAFERDAGLFFQQRFAGLQPVNGCGSIAAGNSLAPDPVPSTAPGLRVIDLGLSRHRHRRGGLRIRLISTAGAWPDLNVALRRGSRVLARATVLRLVRRRGLVLRVRGRAPARGRYELTVTQGFVTLVHRRLLVR